MGYVLEVSRPSARNVAPMALAAPTRIYVTGDTLVHADLSDIPRKFAAHNFAPARKAHGAAGSSSLHNAGGALPSAIDLAILHLGGTSIFGGAMIVTMTGKQGVQLIQMLKPSRVLPIHYDDYDVFKSGLDDFQDACKKAGVSDDQIILCAFILAFFDFLCAKRCLTSMPSSHMYTVWREARHISSSFPMYWSGENKKCFEASQILV